MNQMLPCNDIDIKVFKDSSHENTDMVCKYTYILNNGHYSNGEGW